MEKHGKYLLIISVFGDDQCDLSYVFWVWITSPHEAERLPPFNLISKASPGAVALLQLRSKDASVALVRYIVSVPMKQPGTAVFTWKCQAHPR